MNRAGNTPLNQVVASQDGTDSGFYLKYYPTMGSWEFMRAKSDVTNPPTVSVSSTSAATVIERGTLLADEIRDGRLI